MDVSILEKIGLTRNQSIVYLSLLKLGSTAAQNIIKESGLHSSRVYDGLEKLQQLGLASHVVKGHKKYFQCVKPEKLLDYLDEQKEVIKQILPQLKQLEGMKKEEINASVYKGKEGIKSILSLILKENKEWYILGAKGLIYSELLYYMPNFERERRKRKMRYIRLFDSKEVQKTFIKYKLDEGKALPKGFGGETALWIFGGKVAILLWKERYPTAFLIDKPEVADSFRKWFKLIYRNLK